MPRSLAFLERCDGYSLYPECVNMLPTRLQGITRIVRNRDEAWVQRLIE